jgi:hypothetical protein
MGSPPLGVHVAIVFDHHAEPHAGLTITFVAESVEADDFRFMSVLGAGDRNAHAECGGRSKYNFY